MADVNTGFSNGELLKDIRENVLNPIAVKVAGLGSSISRLESKTNNSFKKAEADLPQKTITFTANNDTTSEIDLTGMFREGSDLTVVDNDGTSHKLINKIDFQDSKIINTSSGEVEIYYDWAKIVPSNQQFLGIGKTGNVNIAKPKSLYFKGTDVSVDTTTVSGSLVTTVTIPDKTPPLKGQISDGAASDLKSLKITGNTTSSSISNGVLTIDLVKSAEGLQYFKGFYTSLGDLISEIPESELVNGKSFAFVKDDLLGGLFYTPYMYIGSSWTEVKTDPAITYSAPSSSVTQGVFSIKADSKIKIDPKGELDLSGLYSPPTPSYFHGFYNTLDELKNSVTSPTLDRSFAYVKHANGAWLGREWKYSPSAGSNAWVIMAPLGGISLSRSPGSSEMPIPLYGFYANDNITIDGNGLASINNTPTKLPIEISDRDGNLSTGEVGSIKFLGGQTYVSIDSSNKKLTINPPQRVIQYNSDFESNHNTLDYEGNIFYDENSRSWMGWTVPDAPGAVDVKWTRIAHRGMSDEVKSLTRRVPEKAPSVLPGVLGDNGRWQYNGFTFVEKDDPTLPDSFRNICGAYILTLVQDKDDPEVTIPQYRMQLCYADREQGDAYLRQFIPNSTGSSSVWGPWVRFSLTTKDLSDHNTDPGAHSLHHKFYKVVTWNLTYQELKNRNYIISDKDCLLVADNYGSSIWNQDKTTVPYTGDFKFSGRVSLDNMFVGSLVAKSQWIIQLYRYRNSDPAVKIADFAYSHDSTTDTHPCLTWETGKIQLEYGDKIQLYIRSMNDSLFPTTAPYLSFIPMRTYMVMEDFETDSGYMIAETQRKLLGPLYSRGDAGINAHRNVLDDPNSTLRLYASAINLDFKPMTKII